VYFILTVNGTQQADTERIMQQPSSGSSSRYYVSSINKIVTVNGSQAVEIDWYASAGTGTCSSATFTFVKIA
jgi:hypothetical protein